NAGLGQKNADSKGSVLVGNALEIATAKGKGRDEAAQEHGGGEHCTPYPSSQAAEPSKKTPLLALTAVAEVLESPIRVAAGVPQDRGCSCR
ncbi:MAG: hypothetical protein QGH76_08450, partial [Phycisphaerales bacterium]|nr:hypothetical protein [Phycisphaerales bacterium]